MQPKTAIPEKERNVIVVPSKLSRAEDIEDGEETEITAQITLPQEGGWGWVVVCGAFCSLSILDGVSFTFGSIYSDMTEDLQISEALVTFLNSLAIAIYFIAGPLASALINRYGFRACIMVGSIISSLALFCTFFCTNYVALCFFYGVMAGFGYCIINFAAGLVVGFYFEKLRSLAISIATNGSSIGVMVMYPLNAYLVNIAGWRVVVLLHSGMLGMVFFLGMTFRPLLSLTVVKTTEDPAKTVTFLPNISTTIVRGKNEGFKSTATERLFSAVSNVNYPTAADIFEEEMSHKLTQPGPSTAAVSRITVTAQTAQKGMSPRQLKQVQSMKSRTSLVTSEGKRRNVELTVEIEPVAENKERKKCCARFFHWEEHIPQSRPMYRDDAFYSGKLERLPIYQKSVMDIAAEERTGLEYQLAVSRAVTANELKEKNFVFTTAVRRILVTMMDPTLLKKKSFIVISFSCLIVYVGYLTPFVFVVDRNRKAGIESKHCSLIVSVIGFANALGRPLIGALACKVNPLRLFTFSCFMSGVSTIVSTLYYDAYYQYVCWFIFGFFIASLACLRSLLLVQIYGLEKLTNATGIVLLFQGIGSLISTPLASELKKTFGYDVAFYFAGICMIVSGLLILPVKTISSRESNV